MEHLGDRYGGDSGPDLTHQGRQLVDALLVAAPAQTHPDLVAVAEDVAPVDGPRRLDGPYPVALRSEDLAQTVGLLASLGGTDAHQDGKVAVHEDRVLDEDTVGVVIGWRSLDDLPAVVGQRVDVGLPLTQRQVDVDGAALDVGHQAVGQTWGRATDEGKSTVHAIEPSQHHSRSTSVLLAHRVVQAHLRRDWHPWDVPESKPRVLVVDDDKAVRDSLRRSLEFNGYEVVLACDGAEALVTLGTHHPDVVVMDVMMPRLDGVETTRALRAAGNDVPVLVLTARDAVGDRVEGLDAGADDYLTKPFALEELLARLRALLRRAVPDPDAGSEVLAFADLTMDVATRDVVRAGRVIGLTRTEFTLLEMFLRRPRRVLERSFILEEVWGFDFPTSANSLEVYVGYLRRKTETEGETRLIQTVRGVGYVLKES